MKISETILVVLSDMHTGGKTALFPPKFQGGGHEDNLILPNERQKEIRPVFVRLAGEVSIARKGRRVILVNLGDAIDGFHHGSLQETLFKTNEQCDAHVLLMDEFMHKIGWNKADELYYVKGTETHVGDDEEKIAKQLGAKKSSNGTFIHDILELNINGTNHLFFHHGKERGSGQNEGNSLRNYLRDLRDERRKEGLRPIDFVWSGHTHGHTYNTHVVRMNGSFHVLHGVICPSFQAKTRYAYGKVPTAINSVGGVYLYISVDGRMGEPKFVTQITEDK